MPLTVIKPLPIGDEVKVTAHVRACTTPLDWRVRDACGDALPTFTEIAVKTMMTAREAKSWFFICVFSRESHLVFCLLGTLGMHECLKVYDLINLTLQPNK